MATNFIQAGNVVTVPAPSAVASGDVVIVGSLVGIAAGDAASGADLDLALTGIYELPKVAVDAVTAGAPIFWTGSLATTADDDGGDPAEDLPRIGTAVEAAATSTGTVKVRLVQP